MVYPENSHKFRTGELEIEYNKGTVRLSLARAINSVTPEVSYRGLLQQTNLLK